MVFSSKWKDAHESLSPLDVVHARVASQLFEVLTGQPLITTLKLRVPIWFGDYGRSHISSDITKFMHGKDFNILSDNARILAGDFREYCFSYGLTLEKFQSSRGKFWRATDGVVSVTRPDIPRTGRDSGLGFSDFKIKWLIKGQIELVPSFPWVRCGFKGRDVHDRCEVPNVKTD